MYILQNGYPKNRWEYLYLKDLGVELSGGQYDDYGGYETENYYYDASVVTLQDYKGASAINVGPKSGYYHFVYDESFFEDEKDRCYSCDNEIGRYICHYLESQGWEYNEGDY